MKKGTLSTVILILVFLVGLSLLLYPTVSDYWNSLHSSWATSSYVQQVANLDNDRYDRIWEAARSYNKTLPQKKDRYELSDAEKEEYKSLLNVSDTGIIGILEIPVIDCSLPVYHGTEEGVLQSAIGHIEGTSLPTGGLGTHTVLSGHRGLPSARLFTDLDKLTVGDVFLLQILDETLTYEVDQILIVVPYELEALEIDPDQDYCTLVTCTPYGINTHRLLVRGHRVENQVEEEVRTVRVTADARQIEPMIVAPLVAVPMLLVLLILLLITTRKKR